MFNILVMPSCRGLFTMPPESEREEVLGMQGMARKLSEKPYLCANQESVLENLCRHNTVVLAVYARLNFASKKPVAHQRGHHVKRPNCYASEQLQQGKPDSVEQMVSHNLVEMAVPIGTDDSGCQYRHEQ